MSEERLDAAGFLKAIAGRLDDFLKDELAIEVSQTEYHLGDHNRIELRYLTSLLGVKGQVQMFILFSFDKLLIQHVYEAYTAELTIEDDEKELMMDETSGDLLNIVIGNVLSTISKKGKRNTVTPPLTLTDAKNLVRHRNATVKSADLLTASGLVSIYCVWPK
ncbi:MAG: chemotaxis protein CheX [Gammaproteobacteria bacterium]|nr:chemotaxis protein CheX [Gammaproteobacteria bacterium]